MKSKDSVAKKAVFSFSVVQKLIIGFVSLAVLLVVTSVLSYFGLRDIKHSAEIVAFEKMPMQNAAAKVNENILILARITNIAYFETELPHLDIIRADFEEYKVEFEEELKNLNAFVSSKNNEKLQQAVLASEQYFKASQALFDSKASALVASENLAIANDNALNSTDEASALMLDLSYLEGNTRDLENLIGMSTNIDNKLGLMLSSIKELFRETDPQKTLDIIDNLEYSLSNVKVDVDYAKRVAESIDDQGILAMFDEQYSLMLQHLSSNKGMFVIKKSQLDAQAKATSERKLADDAVTSTIAHLNELSDVVNNDALIGQENILDSVQSSVLKSVIISVIGIIATVSLAIIATRSIAIPLGQVNTRLEILSRGDLSKTMDDSGCDEFSVLAKNVNRLIEALRALVGSIHEKEATLRDVATQNIAMGEKSLDEAASQQKQIDTTSEITHKVKDTSLSNIEQIKQADTKVFDVIGLSDNVVALVNQSLQQVQQQTAQSKHSAEIVNRLGENSNKIGSILDVIKIIAEQTNLLALNAAIEAARAGEQGRGFAVVADEVRTLATRTQNSTAEIEKMIVNLQQDSQKAVSAMNEGAEQVTRGAELTEQVTTKVNQIRTEINQLAVVNHKIVDDTTAQDSLLEDVVSRLETIVRLSRSSANTAKVSNDANHEIEAHMNALKEAVGKFTL